MRISAILPAIVIIVLSSTRGTAGGRILTLQDRIEAQRAIEQVYWRHHIWPQDNVRRKPTFEERWPANLIRSKVATYMKKSAALEKFWSPINRQQIQTELDRIARETRSPHVLQELFDALHHDPLLIAECLVRPVLVDRLIRSWYPFDERFHGDVRRVVQHALDQDRGPAAISQMGYSEVELLAVEPEDDEDRATSRSGSIIIDRASLDRIRSSVMDSDPLGIGSGVAPPVISRHDRKLTEPLMGRLREDEDRFYATAVLEDRPDRLRLGVVSWPKRTFDDWWASVESELAIPADDVMSAYSYPQLIPESCVDDSWVSIKSTLPDHRSNHVALWTGTEMLVWGGLGYSGYLNSGSRYDPATDTWTSMGIDSATPSPRDEAVAVWTGDEMLVWGGYDGSWKGDGARYNPQSDSWTAMSSGTGVPTARAGHTAVWTGSRMVICGGYNGSMPPFLAYQTTGSLYDPSSDTWLATAPGGGRSLHSALWTGTEMLVFGGYDGFSFPGGSRYNPTTNTWTNMSAVSAPGGRTGHAAVWTGSEMIVWGGSGSTGGRYNPTTNSWLPTRNDATTPQGRTYTTGVWTGTEMIVWGGQPSSGPYVNTGGRYNPVTDTWVPTSTAAAPSGRRVPTSAWTGTEMIVWGGQGDRGFNVPQNTGGRYDPATDTWIPLDDLTPRPRTWHSVVWTGTEMIVWGGASYNDVLSSGGRYDPALDNWIATSTVGAPTRRDHATAVWTGTEMIVWGGHDSPTGGRYNPQSDTWLPTRNEATTPGIREWHTAIWSGSHMIIWGGSWAGTAFNSGGQYDPATDTWMPTLLDATTPSPRTRHSVVWTGSEMIVWGGNAGVNMNTGGRYDPNSNTWTPLNADITAPAPRNGHSAVWTGSEMIIWGGDDLGNDLDTGGRYHLASDTWLPTRVDSSTPAGRDEHSAVWTGAEMTIWGGSGLNTGGRYDPSDDSWKPSSVDVSTPVGRAGHTHVWTGSEIIVWGGHVMEVHDWQRDGGRYCSCTQSMNAYYRDADGDGHGDPLSIAWSCNGQLQGYSSQATDCSDADGLVWATPGEVADLVFPAFSSEILSWTPVENTGATSVMYDTIRTLDVADFFNAQCTESNDGTDTESSDSSVPPLGLVYYYLVRAVNGCPGDLGQGSLGVSSEGTPREGRNCP